MAMVAVQHRTIIGTCHMSDAREALEMMRQVAKTRIAMLEDGVTFHDERNRVYYLREYGDKLRRIDEIIRRLNIRLVHSRRERGPDDGPS